MFDKVVMLSGITGEVRAGVILHALTDVQCQLSALGVDSGAAIRACLPFDKDPAPSPLLLINMHAHVNTCVHMH